MKSVKSILVVMLMAISCICCMAQNNDKPIKWRMNVKMISDTEGEVIIKAIIDPEWHLYGMKLPTGGPKPTSVDLSASVGVKFTSKLTYSPNVTISHDDMFAIDLSWWTGAVTFRRNFKVTDASNAQIVSNITYMGCNNKNCLPPSTEKISKRIPTKK